MSWRAGLTLGVIPRDQGASGKRRVPDGSQLGDAILGRGDAVAIQDLRVKVPQPRLRLDLQFGDDLADFAKAVANRRLTHLWLDALQHLIDGVVGVGEHIPQGLDGLEHRTIQACDDPRHDFDELRKQQIAFVLSRDMRPK